MRFFKRFAIVILALGLVGTVIFLTRRPILRGIGHVLIKEDAPQPVDAIFVLSGYAAERCPKAVELYQQGLSPVLVVTGENVNPTLQALDIELIDAVVGQRALFDLGVDSTAVRVLPRGTSTFEESEEILGFSLAEGYRRIMVVSSKFHTRRIQRTFHQKFHAEGIELRVIGADPPQGTYLVDEWWKSEEGLIFVNNEYLKLLYYAMKY